MKFKFSKIFLLNVGILLYSSIIFSCLPRTESLNSDPKLIPDEDRFVKTVLIQGTLFEPMEMAVLPNLDVLIVQRRGDILIYKNKTGEIKEAGFIDTYHKASVPRVNAEEGILGIALDPDFYKNNFVYISYSTPDSEINRLSRFKLNNDRIVLNSEKVVLEFFSQRQICCHTGGSIAFGPGRLLYLSTGDNSTPFNERGQKYVNHGFAPLDDRPGHEQYDARRSSGNTNDLRGKIIRIRIKEDGSYAIPEGNLFDPGETKARPEIYVMGNRNPFRISVDQKNSFLYWGEVGPDAGNDSLNTRGPRGYDEVNQARAAGFFGWPLFIANNLPYYEYDYETGKTGKLLDPAKPENNSRNNTGLKNLPPAQPAFIYYPYGSSDKFPEVGEGGRTAMAGPVYYTDLYNKSTRYPEYYNGKLFIYEWVRNWIKVVTMNENGDLEKIEPFMSNTKFSAPMDMEVGPDGRLYILEYGKGWFSKNADAALVRIDFIEGNLPPKILADLQVEKTSGNSPFLLEASIEVKDPENQKLDYIWTIGNKKIVTKEPQLSHKLIKKGDYKVQVEIMDSERAITKSRIIDIYIGNEEPKVNISLLPNRSFYFEDKLLQYKVTANEKNSATENFYITAEVISSMDLAGASLGHQILTVAMEGKNIMSAANCTSCHKTDEKSIGPSFIEISGKYNNKKEDKEYLNKKIKVGGSGVWGSNAMPAHPNLKEQDIDKVVEWIFSLTGTASKNPSLPLEGEIKPASFEKLKGSNILKVFASYTNNPVAGIRPLTGSQTLFLRNSNMPINEFKALTGIQKFDTLGAQHFRISDRHSELYLGNTDLTNIKAIELEIFNNKELKLDVVLESGVLGKSIGKGSYSTGSNKVVIPLNSSINNFDNLFFKLRTDQKGKIVLKSVNFKAE
jgi:cytochrome c